MSSCSLSYEYRCKYVLDAYHFFCNNQTHLPKSRFIFQRIVFSWQNNKNNEPKIGWWLKLHRLKRYVENFFWLVVICHSRHLHQNLFSFICLGVFVCYKYFMSNICILLNDNFFGYQYKFISITIILAIRKYAFRFSYLSQIFIDVVTVLTGCKLPKVENGFKWKKKERG